MVTSRTVFQKKFRSVGGGRKAHALEVRKELFQWFVDVRPALTHDYRRLFFFYKLRNFMQIDCNSIYIHLRKNTSSSQTNGSRAGNLNIESLCETQINAIQFPKKTVALEYKIT